MKIFVKSWNGVSYGRLISSKKYQIEILTSTAPKIALKLNISIRIFFLEHDKKVSWNGTDCPVWEVSHGTLLSTVLIRYTTVVSNLNNQ